MPIKESVGGCVSAPQLEVGGDQIHAEKCRYATVSSPPPPPRPTLGETDACCTSVRLCSHSHVKDEGVLSVSVALYWHVVTGCFRH